MTHSQLTRMMLLHANHYLMPNVIACQHQTDGANVRLRARGEARAEILGRGALTNYPIRNLGVLG